MKHEPKPLIEEHWHIQNLIKSQQKRAEEREYYRSQAKDKTLRGDLITDSQEFTPKDFFCKKCDVDFISLAHKQVEIDWTNTDQSIAFYKTKHKKCGTWVMRYVTDRLKDPYWQLSKVVATDRGKHSLDLLQPFENNYNLVYGKK